MTAGAGGQGLEENKVTILGVEAPAWLGATTTV